MRDNNDNERGLLDTIRKVAAKTHSAITGRPIVRRCRDCNQWLMQDDEGSPCGAHQPIPEDASPIYLNFTPSPEPREPVSRIEREVEPKRVRANPRYSEKYALPEEDDPLVYVPPKRDDGGYVRKVGLKGNNDPFIQAQRNVGFDYEPSIRAGMATDNDIDSFTEEPDVPEYRLQKY